MKNTLSKYLDRTKLQLAILAVLLVIANRYFDLGLSPQDLTLTVVSLISYIVGEGARDVALALRDRPQADSNK